MSPQETIPLMTSVDPPPRPNSLTLGQYTPNSTRTDRTIIPPVLADEPTVMMRFPHKVALNLDNYGGLVVFQAGTQAVPVSLQYHSHLKKNGVTVYQKTAPDTLGLTDKHVKFLQSQGVQISSVEAAVEFVKQLDPMARAKFHAEVTDWKPKELDSRTAAPVEDETEVPEEFEENLQTEIRKEDSNASRKGNKSRNNK